jgi:prefoldin subunit 5
MNNVKERLLELDDRQGELLDKLARLDQQIDDVLKEWTATKEVPTEWSASAPRGN